LYPLVFNSALQLLLFVLFLSLSWKPLDSPCFSRSLGNP
jgi:hypothetical protein